MMKDFDVIVIGAGHAGIEAALASARMGQKTLLATLLLEEVGFMACNPAIGGTAKGHLVREVDALGGEMGVAADKALLQIKMLNTAKGPAVHSLRGQEDKRLYQEIMLETLKNQPNLTLMEGEVTELLTKDKKVRGVRFSDGEEYAAKAVVLATGVYLDSRVITGEEITKSGPAGFPYAKGLTKSLVENGLQIRRFKTGTPARIKKSSIDFGKMETQEGDETIHTFSFLHDEKLTNQLPCYLTYTNAETHKIIVDNIDRAPMYNGSITGVGPRYCPSIETKIMRFRDKERHQIFVEPEERTGESMYIQGMSTSMPKDVQEAMYRTIPGLEHCEFLKYAYAIEYDCINPLQLTPWLGVKCVEGLFSAGQINGSSGYEEAAAQGVVAGINAALYVQKKPPYVITRDKAYIGVLIDDLVTKGTEEPYRMMTARAEHRLFLRQDNADLRLTADGYKLGLATAERYEKMQKKAAEIEEIKALAKMAKVDARTTNLYKAAGMESPLKNESVFEALRHSEITVKSVVENVSGFENFSDRALETAEVEIKYEGYLQKAENAIKEQKRLEEKLLPPDIDYQSLSGLRLEARQKLSDVRPLSVAQAARISGVSPADVAVLLVYLSREHK